MTLKQALVFGAVFGFVAAIIVWYLERFELNRLHGEVRHYLKNYEAFKSYMKEHGQ